MAANEALNVIVGAFDRHNFGDLLFAHLAQADCSGECVFAGVAQRDLRSCGGHEVNAIADLAPRVGERPVRVIHAGGELLDCDAWEAAVMVLEAEAASAVVFRLGADVPGRLRWAAEMTGLADRVPYCVARRRFANVQALEYRAVGGVGLATRPRSLRSEVLSKLREADRVEVRDKTTLAFLSQAGIVADLMPDPVTSLVPRFSPAIGTRAVQGEVLRVREAFPQGYVAVQFSADFGDDATLAILAGQLDRVAGETGWGVVFFCAGAAPWHDDMAVYERLAGFMRTQDTMRFSSLHVWDVCALLSNCRAYCGSSLHGRLVARAFGVPGASLLHGQGGGKVPAYWQTWYPEESGSLATAGGIAEALLKG